VFSHSTYHTSSSLQTQTRMKRSTKNKKIT
jgi:hypothetical protein